MSEFCLTLQGYSTKKLKNFWEYVETVKMKNAENEFLEKKILEEEETYVQQNFFI